MKTFKNLPVIIDYKKFVLDFNVVFNDLNFVQRVEITRVLLNSEGREDLVGVLQGRLDYNDSKVMKKLVAVVKTEMREE